MTNKQLYDRLIKGIMRPAAAFELRQLFMHRTGWDARMPMGGDERVASDDADWLTRAAARLDGGYPLQYILGRWEFYGLPFNVGPGVLIPQPDTETLVRAALDAIGQMQQPRVADLCAGSGAVGIAVAKSHPGVLCWAVELSECATEYLAQNIELNGLEGRVIPVMGDVTRMPELPVMDVVVSNPPYLARWEIESLPPEVAAEPEMALLGGEDGLLFYRAISAGAKNLLRSAGVLLFEVGHTQGAAVAQIMRGEGYGQIELIKDYSGIDRCVGGAWPG